MAQWWKGFVPFLCTRVQASLVYACHPAVPYMFTGLTGCSVSPGISCGARKLTRIPRVTKKKNSLGFRMWSSLFNPFLQGSLVYINILFALFSYSFEYEGVIIRMPCMQRKLEHWNDYTWMILHFTTLIQAFLCNFIYCKTKWFFFELL